KMVPSSRSRRVRIAPKAVRLRGGGSLGRGGDSCDRSSIAIARLKSRTVSILAYPCRRPPPPQARASPWSRQIVIIGGKARSTPRQRKSATSIRKITHKRNMTARPNRVGWGGSRGDQGGVGNGQALVRRGVAGGIGRLRA